MVARMVAWLLRHATRVMPPGRAGWGEAMRCEFEHVRDQPDALAWVVGCVVASSRSRLAELRRHHLARALRRAAACGVLAVVVGTAFEDLACGQTPPPAFTETACDLPHITPELRPRLRCGVVGVPRDYARPDAGQWRLAVVVIRSATQPASPDPVAYVSGGPGGPLTVYAAAQAAHPLATGRDIILVDQRGTGRSEPLLCPSLEGSLADALVEAAIDPAAEERRRALFAACRADAAARGIDLAGFGTPVTVEDFERVRQALGIARWNLFGVSYGTTVAMTLMARHPETIRAAVLDSINPPDPILPSWSANVADAVAAFLAACRDDAGCAALYPDLAGTYRETLDQLRRQPLDLPLPAGLLPAGLHGPGGHGALTAGLFELVVGRMAYFPRFYPGLPRLIAQVHGGHTAEFAAAVAALYAEARDADTGTRFSANAAIDCRDRPRFRDPPGPDAGVFDRLSLYGICGDWVQLGPPPLVPIGTTIPTLMLAGEFDPNARPAASRGVAALIGRHVQWVEVAGAGHSVRSASPCVAAMVAAFFADPGRPVDAACAARPAPLRFLPP
jgi:pimeloyl-ACP methyl ester carboxylesterase